MSTANSAPRRRVQFAFAKKCILTTYNDKVVVRRYLRLFKLSYVKHGEDVSCRMPTGAWTLTGVSYPLSAYQRAFMLCFAVTMVYVVAGLLIKETRCQNIYPMIKD